MDANKTGKLISELRKKQGLTQAELAERLLVSDKAISRWETGKGYPDITNLEALAGVLGVSVGEILNGETLNETVTAKEIRGSEQNMLTALRETFRKKSVGYAVAGFLLGLALVILTVVHLTSPRYIDEPLEALSVETLSDGRIVAVLSENVSGADISRVREPESDRTQVFVSCYRTLWDRIRHRSGERLIILGGEDVDEVYYYPVADAQNGGDWLLYRRDAPAEGSGGVQTLPRLIYNYWFLLGIVFSVLGIAAVWFSRKKYYARTVFRIAALPVAFTVSLLCCLIGKFGEVYNAAFYLSGILLLGAVIYAIVVTVDTVRRSNRPSAASE